ncbi:MAG: intradiol ring-cleavage dioxygenase [Pseudomonadota bacterium]
MTDDTRRGFLITTGSLAASFGFMGEGFSQELSPTPECKDSDEPTAAQTEGPFFKPRSPQRADLREASKSGTPVELAGLVLTKRCKPVAGALIDLWHADDKGDYDNKGFRYRGHLFTDANGVFRFRTIQPALYPGRTRHYHVKVQPKGGRVLTTQLYFPGEPGNARDGLFRKELLMRMASAQDGLSARFDFVLDIS